MHFVGSSTDGESDLPSKPSIKIRELIMALNGPRSVQQLIEEHGWEAPKLESVEGWFRRSSAPCGWTVAMIYIAQRKGILKGNDLERLLREDV